VKVGHTVSIRAKSQNIPQIVNSIKDTAKRDRLPFVEADVKKLEGRLLSEPQLSDLPIPIQENLIVELYSK
jgi:small subunit ribosomal protein S4